jgi:hypothetical protein
MSGPGERQATEAPVVAASGRARGADGKYRRTVESVERDAYAAALHARGWSFRAIAGELGYAGSSAAYKAVQRVLRDTAVPVGTELRAAALARIDEALADLDQTIERAWESAGREHLVVNVRGVVEWEGKPLRDDGPVLAALRVITDALRTKLAYEERRARLLGLDAETKISLGGGVRYEVIGVSSGDLV